MKRKLISTLAAGILTAAYILLTIFEINGKELSKNPSFWSHIVELAPHLLRDLPIKLKNY